MAPRFRMEIAPLGERAALAFVSLDFCDAMFRIGSESHALDVDESLSLLSIRNQAIQTLQEAGYLTQ